MEMIRAGSVGIVNRVDHVELGLDLELEVERDTEWEEKGRTMISQIYISFDSKILRSIQFAYLENGALVLSSKYGTSSEGHSFRVVRLNPDEFVTGLSGEIVLDGGIRNLTFRTNRGMHGPIGNSDSIFASRSKIEIDPAIIDRGEFGGFFGSYCSGGLTSIGIYVNPVAMSVTSG